MRMMEADTECPDINMTMWEWRGGGRLPGYLAALVPGWGCLSLGRWLFELPLFAARGPGRLSPPNGQAACPVLSPVSVLLECDQTPLSDLLSPIPAGPTTRREANHVKALTLH